MQNNQHLFFPHLKNSINLVVKSLPHYLLFALLFHLPIFILLGISIYLANNTALGDNSFESAANLMGSINYESFLIKVLDKLAIYFVLTNIFIYILLSFKQQAVINNEKFYFFKSLFKAILPFIYLLILCSILFVIYFLMSLLKSEIIEYIPISINTIPFAVIVSIFILLPVIFLATIFYIASPAIIFEKNLIHSISERVKNINDKTFLKLISLNLLIYCIYLILNIYLEFELVKFLSGNKPKSEFFYNLIGIWPGALFFYLIYIFNFFLLPIFSALGISLYFQENNDKNS